MGRGRPLETMACCHDCRSTQPMEGGRVEESLPGGDDDGQSNQVQAEMMVYGLQQVVRKNEGASWHLQHL